MTKYSIKIVLIQMTHSCYVYISLNSFSSCNIFNSHQKTGIDKIILISRFEDTITINIKVFFFKMMLCTCLYFQDVVVSPAKPAASCTIIFIRNCTLLQLLHLPQTQEKKQEQTITDFRMLSR